MKKKPTPPPETIISVAHAAKLWGCTTRTIQRKIKRGELQKVIGKDGREGFTQESLTAAFNTPTHPDLSGRQGGDMSGATPRPVGATVAATGARHVAHLDPTNAAVIARLEANLEAERQRYTDLEEARRREATSLEEARQREVARQNDHIDSLRTELAAANARAEAAHLENQNLHRQLADARRHETERARINPPTPSADILDNKPDIMPTKLKSKKPDSRYHARNSPSTKAPTIKTKQPAGWWSKWFG